MLDNLGSEVSSKIREAIKAKLQELNAYVDDELPDYIMVMVANKKTPEVMKEDLGLFLNDHTDVFVDWLAQVLEKLKKVTLGDGKSKKKKILKKLKKSTGEEGGTKKKKKVSKTSPSSKKKSTPTKKKSLKKVNNTLGEEGLPSSPIKPSSSSRTRVRTPTPPRISKRSPSRSPSPYDRNDRGREWRRDERYHRSRSPRERSRGEKGSFGPEGDRRSNYYQSNKRISQSSRGDGGGRQHYDDHDMSSSSSRYHEKNNSSRSYERSNNSSRPNLSSKIGAVISHESDGEYDPEQLLKKSIRASVVKVTDRPKSKPVVSANKNLVMKAVAEADASIQRKEREDRQKDAELRDIHNKRFQLTKALKAGKLDGDKIEEINKKTISKRTTSLTKESKSDLKQSDLRNDLRSRLGKRVTDDRHDEKRDLPPPSLRDPSRLGITVLIRNDDGKQLQRSEEPLKSDRRHHERLQPDKRRHEIQTPHDNRHHHDDVDREQRSKIKMKLAENAAVTARHETSKSNSHHHHHRVPPRHDEHEDSKLEQMRRRALESMQNRRQESAEDKKIIIPLDEDSSEEEEEEDTDNEEGKNTPDSSSNDSSSGDDSSSDSGSEVSLSDVDELQGKAESAKSGKSNPQFIVTLDGINKDYFGKSHSDVPTGPLRHDSNKKAKLLEPKKEPTSPPKQPLNLPTTPVRKELAQHPVKPLAPVVGQKRPLEKKMEIKKEPNKAPVIAKKAKPEAIVAPLRMKMSAEQKRPTSIVHKTSSSSIKTVSEPKIEEKEKPKRARITAPEPDKPKETKLVSSLPPHLLSGKPIVTASSESKKTNGSKSICRYWPKCTRGDQCFFFHPKPKSPSLSTGADKFRWTSAGALT